MSGDRARDEDERAPGQAGKRSADTERKKKHRSQHLPRIRAGAGIAAAGLTIAAGGAVIGDIAAQPVIMMAAVHFHGYQLGAASLTENPDDGDSGFGGAGLASALTPAVVTGGTIGVNHNIGPHPSGL